MRPNTNFNTNQPPSETDPLDTISVPMLDLRASSAQPTTNCDQLHDLTEFLGPFDRVDTSMSPAQAAGHHASPQGVSGPSSAYQPAAMHLRMPHPQSQFTSPFGPVLDFRPGQTARSAQRQSLHDLSEMLPHNEHIAMRELPRLQGAQDTTTLTAGSGSARGESALTSRTLSPPPGYRSTNSTELLSSTRIKHTDSLPSSTQAQPNVDSLPANFLVLGAHRDAERGEALQTSTETRSWYAKKRWWFTGLVVVAGAVGAGVGVSVSRKKSADSSDNSYGDNNNYTPLVSMPSSAFTPAQTTSTSLIASSLFPVSSTMSTSAAAAQTSAAALLPWGSGGYQITETKQLDTCGPYDITCKNPITDTWYVSQANGQYKVVNNGNSSVWTVPGQQGSTSLSLNFTGSTTTNSDGCIFDDILTYQLTVGPSSVSGQLTLAASYNLDIQCVETSGNFIQQGQGCECQWTVSSKKL